MNRVFFLSLFAMTAAFVVKQPMRSSCPALNSEAIPVEPELIQESIPTIPAPIKKVAIKAKWLPFINAPIILDGSLAGDAGFDPLGFSKSQKTLFWMREAELKHARLAMLAAVGWPLSELYHKELASAFNLPSILAGADRAPSLLNGGLSSGWASGMLIMSIIIAGLLEGTQMNKGDIFWNVQKSEGYIPGDMSFDPLGLYGLKNNNKKTMEENEIKNGRLAMMAITYFAFSEFSTGLPVVQQTPYLF